MRLDSEATVIANPEADPALGLLQEPIVGQGVHRSTDLLKAESPGYTLLGKVGQGGWGTVYRARQNSTGRHVALKVVRSDVAGNPEVRQRFLREVKAISRLHHPHIVTLHEFGQTRDGMLFMAMEFADGDTLDEMLRRHGQIDVPTAIKVARQVALALGEAHAQDVIHRDIKPHNIMVGDVQGFGLFVKVLDFGIARFANAPQGLTAEGRVFGTPEYMSPEVARAQPLDFRADLYSLGIVLYEMLTGKPPFTGEHAMAVAMSQVYDAPPPLPRRLKIPKDLADLVMQLLAKEPLVRPSSARDVARRLEAMEMALEGRRPAKVRKGEEKATLQAPPAPRSGLPRAATPQTATLTGASQTGAGPSTATPTTANPPVGSFPAHRGWLAWATGGLITGLLVVGIMMALDHSGPASSPATDSQTASEAVSLGAPSAAASASASAPSAGTVLVQTPRDGRAAGLTHRRRPAEGPVRLELTDRHSPQPKNPDPGPMRALAWLGGSAPPRNRDR